MRNMFGAKVNSPITRLSFDIDDTQTIIELDDVSVLPDAPNLITISNGNMVDDETCLYTSLDGNFLTVVRGFEGSKRSWEKGTYVARVFTAYDHNSFKYNIESLNENKADRVLEFVLECNSVDTEYVINHNKGTKKLICQIYDSEDSLVYTSIKKDSENSVKVGFGYPQPNKIFKVYLYI